MPLINTSLNFAEKGMLPDSFIRAGIRKLVNTRLDEISASDCETGMANITQFIQNMNKSEIAPMPELANAQHYEVPADFFSYCLGKHRKYSSCFWMPETKNLDEAEMLALIQTCEHADLKDGQIVKTLQGGELIVSIKEGKVMINGAAVTTASYTKL